MLTSDRSGAVRSRAVPSITIKGTGAKLASGAKVCISGDEKNVKLSGVNYLSGAFAGGNGTLTIDSLVGDQLAQPLRADETAWLDADLG